MAGVVTKDTTLCISLSARPSNFGTRFHNFLYAELGLDFVYKAFRTDDIRGAIAGVRALGIRGCAVSMPFKVDVMELVDEIEPSAADLGAVNTIVNDDGHLTASNTDVEAVEQLLAERGVGRDLPVVVRGSGGMAAATVAAFRRAGFTNITLWARNEKTGASIAERFGVALTSDEPTIDGAVLVNVTPIGMAGPDVDGLAFSPSTIASAALVVDAVAYPWRTPLIVAAQSDAIPIITGADIVALQAARQFVRYTGVTPSDDLVAHAAEHARAE